MAAAGYGVYFGGGFSITGNQGPNREDLLDIIYNIDPSDTPLFVRSPKTVAKHVFHEWLQDALQATSSAYYADEGADYSFSTASQTSRTRVGNWTMIFRKDINSSQTQRAVDPAGVQDEYAYQVMKGLKELARSIEASSFIVAAATATASTGPRVMKDLATFITTNTASVVNGASASTVSETIFNDMLQNIFDDGGNPDSVYVGAYAKRQISSYTTNTTVARNIALADKRLINSVDLYESDFGIIQIVLDRWVPNGGTATASASGTGRAFFIETPMVRHAFLRPIKHVPLPPNGDAARGIVLGELTLEVGHEKALGMLTGIRGIATV
jgi:hypothetical protein